MGGDCAPLSVDHPAAQLPVRADSPLWVAHSSFARVEQWLFWANSLYGRDRTL